MQTQTHKRISDLHRITATTAMIQARNMKRVGIRPANSEAKPVAIKTQPTPGLALDDTMQDCYDAWPYCNAWDVVGCNAWTGEGDWIEPQTFGYFESDPIDGVNAGLPGPDEYDA